MPSALGKIQRVTGWSSLPVALAALGVIALASPTLAAGGACQNPHALGVSRVVEVDTSAGPHFGHQQYRDIDLLAPGEIVLTFDDGPLRPHTRPILDALDAQCTKATFFMVGSQAIGDPEMVKEVIRRGHTVGSHTWSHANLRKLTPLKARQEVELGLSAVTAAAGQPVAPFFRFPYLADSKSMLGYTQSRALGIFSIEVDSQDWKTKNAASVHRDVLAQLAELGKGIILFHDIQPATAHALPGLLEALRAKGYKVVHLKPKTMATTIPEFDALARDTKARNQVASSEHPLVKHGMTWGAASPTVMANAPSPAAGVGGVPSAANAYTTPARNASAAYRPVVPAQAAVAAPPAPSGPPTAAPAAPVGDPAAANYARLARQRQAPTEDWRDKIFNR